MTSPHPPNPTSNISLGSIGNNPFIWGNIALIAGVPWLLTLSMAGLAVGDPVFPTWFEIFILGFPAIALVTWIQWQQPISPFSLWVVAKSPEDLSDRDRQILTLVKQNQNGWYVTGWLATAVVIVISAVFCKIYIAAPLAQVLAPFPAGLRLFGIIWAEVFFLLSNVLLQAGVSALRIKLTAESELNGLKPFAVEKIKNSFTSIGWRSPQLLKFFEEEAIGENDAPKNDVPQVETADQSLELTPSQDAEELVFENLVAETEPEAIEPSNTTSIDSEQITEESQIETSLEEISQEIEPSETIALIEDLEVAAFSDVDTTPEPELEEFLIDEVQGAEISDVSLDDQLTEEVEDLEISAIVAEESLLDMISAPEIEEFETEDIVDEINIEPILEQEIIREPETIAPIGIAEEVESFLDSTENMSEIADSETDRLLEESQIDASIDAEIVQTEELESIELVEEPQLEESLEVTDTIVEPEIEESVINEPEFNLEVADVLVEEVEITAIAAEESVIETISELEISPETEELNPYEPIEESDNDGELESLETAKTSEDEVIANLSLISSYKRRLDFFKKSRKTGRATKKQGFGKSLRRDRNVTSSPKDIEPEPIKALEKNTIAEPVVELESDWALPDSIFEPEVISELVEEPNIEEISIQVEEALEVPNNENQDFDDEADELVAFNAYVENILSEYLEDADEEIEEVTKEAIAKENIEAFAENLPDLGNQVPEDSPEKISSTDPEPKDSKYLVQEFLVDKFLARLEELNISDKANKANVDKATDISSNNEVDEFADLEALLEGKPLTENSDAEDLSDRNS